jgi:molybdate transport system regulatory protein
MSQTDPLAVRIKIAFGDEARLGPGKMDLLEAVAASGSISAAGRALGMSYRRAWLLIDAVNTMFEEPVVRAAAGGAHGGGASLTPFGERLLAAYRTVEADAARSAQAAFAGLQPAAKTPAKTPVKAG